MALVKVITVLNAVTTTQNSQKIFIGDYDRVAVLFRAAAITSGNGAFTVKAGFAQLASDTPTVTAYNQLVDNLTNTNTQYQVHVNGKTLSSNGDAYLWMDNNTPATHIEIDLAVTTDGTYSAFVIGFQETD
jgi:hypothetical protein